MDIACHTFQSASTCPTSLFEILGRQPRPKFRSGALQTRTVKSSTNLPNINSMTSIATPARPSCRSWTRTLKVLLGPKCPVQCKDKSKAESTYRVSTSGCCIIQGKREEKEDDSNLVAVPHSWHRGYLGYIGPSRASAVVDPCSLALPS